MRKRHVSFIWVVPLVFALAARIGFGQQTDPVAPLLAQLASADLSERETGFYALVSLAPTTTPGAVNAIPGQIAGLLEDYPNDGSRIVSALSGLLALENTDMALGANLAATPQDEADSDFYLDLVEAVAVLNDPATIPSLAGAIASGGMATTALAGFGKAALGPVLTQTYSPYVQVRHAAGFTLITMLKPQFYSLIKDQPSLSMIRAGLSHVVASFAPPSAYSYMQAPFIKALASIGPQIAGDLNGDGIVNCADLDPIKASFGKAVGQQGFDIRADINGDGVVNILDLSAEAKLMPAGTVCN